MGKMGAHVGCIVSEVDLQSLVAVDFLLVAKNRVCPFWLEARDQFWGSILCLGDKRDGEDVVCLDGPYRCVLLATDLQPNECKCDAMRCDAMRHCLHSSSSDAMLSVVSKLWMRNRRTIPLEGFGFSEGEEI